MEVASAIDVALARTQHAYYSRALSSIGLTPQELPADDHYPDCCFIEDCAVVVDGVALLSRSGAASRRGETIGVRLALESLSSIHRVEVMDAPATLDGGDCMRIGNQMFVGRSLRTNSAGVARMRELFHNLTIIEVALAGVLHLKCVCSPLGDSRVLLASGTIAPEVFRGLDIVMIPNEERYAANCVAYSGSALIADEFPQTRAQLERAGFATIALSMSEIRKADGSLTCLSIII